VVLKKVVVLVLVALLVVEAVVAHFSMSAGFVILVA